MRGVVHYYEDRHGKYILSVRIFENITKESFDEKVRYYRNKCKHRFAGALHIRKTGNTMPCD